jgi:cytochrome c peroxidase
MQTSQRTALRLLAAAALGCVPLVGACAPDADSATEVAGAPPTAATAAEVDLGRRLFFDGRISVPAGMSCGTCHDPLRGWSDERPQGKGVQDNTLHNLMVEGNFYKTVLTDRNTPTIYNSSVYPSQFWDGRAGDLAHQATFPVEAIPEMNSNWNTVVLPYLNGDAEYIALFEAAYPGQPISRALAGKAIGAYEASIQVDDTPYDRYLAGDSTALSPEQFSGMNLFFGAAGCGQCHPGPDLTSLEFLNTGVPNAGQLALKGVPDFGFGKRLDLTQDPPVQHDDPVDYCKFKVPHLRMLAVTAPYMHNGSLQTLEEVVEFYDVGGGPDLCGSGNKDPRIVPLGLTAQEKADLVAFLRDGLMGTEIR